jgi:hypothetical protein
MRLKGAAVIAVAMMAAVAGCTDLQNEGSSGPQESASGGAALAAAESLTVKGRAPKTGYDRERFGTAWADTDSNSCDTRVIAMLRRVIVGFSQLMLGVAGCAY